MSLLDEKKPVLQIHETTIPRLGFVERIIFDELLRTGQAEVIRDGAENAS